MARNGSTNSASKRKEEEDDNFMISSSKPYKVVIKPCPPICFLLELDLRKLDDEDKGACMKKMEEQWWRMKPKFSANKER